MSREGESRAGDRGAPVADLSRPDVLVVHPAPRVLGGSIGPRTQELSLAARLKRPGSTVIEASVVKKVAEAPRIIAVGPPRTTATVTVPAIKQARVVGVGVPRGPRFSNHVLPVSAPSAKVSAFGRTLVGVPTPMVHDDPDKARPTGAAGSTALASPSVAPGRAPGRTPGRSFSPHDEPEGAQPTLLMSLETQALRTGAGASSTAPHDTNFDPEAQVPWYFTQSEPVRERPARSGRKRLVIALVASIAVISVTALAASTLRISRSGGQVSEPRNDLAPGPTSPRTQAVRSPPPPGPSVDGTSGRGSTVRPATDAKAVPETIAPAIAPPSAEGDARNAPSAQTSVKVRRSRAVGSAVSDPIQPKGTKREPGNEAGSVAKMKPTSTGPDTKPGSIDSTIAPDPDAVMGPTVE